MTNEIDPLATSCDDIDISYPLLPASIYPMGIIAAEKQNNKANTGENLVIKFENTDAHQSTKGDVIQPRRITLVKYISLTPKEARYENGKNIQAYTNESIKVAITQVVKACKMSGVSPRDIINNPTLLVGKIAPVKVGIKKETAEFPEGNEIKGFVIEG